MLYSIFYRFEFVGSPHMCQTVRSIDVELIATGDKYWMNLTFYTATGGMMSHTLTAIISKFVIQKLLSVNQTTVITAYFYFY